MTVSAHAPRQREAGFALIELVIVLIIVSILILSAVLLMGSAQVASRNEAMRTAGASIDQAVGSFNRMYPVVGGQADRLAPFEGAAWSGNVGTASAGLTDETGEWLLSDWPTDPYTGTPVRVLRSPNQAYCGMGAAGTVRVCRLRAASGRQTYMVVAWGRARDGSPTEVYRASHGIR